MQKDFYTILGVEHRATNQAIKLAFRKLALKYHPDRNQGDKTSEQTFIEIHEAYETLIDENKRRIYDSGVLSVLSSSNPENLKHYFKSWCSVNEVKLNEEFMVNFSYTGEGRYYKRPAFNSFFMSCKPYVTFRTITIDGSEVKETTLAYTLAALIEGKQEIQPATIRIYNILFQTVPISISVKENTCYFMKNKKANGKPYKYKLFVEDIITNKYYRTLTQQHHDVLIPRCREAQRFHTMGSVIKFIFGLWAFIILNMNIGYVGLSLFAGLVFGGINCHLFYFLMGVKSKFYYASKYFVVADYLKQGYFNRVTLFADGNKKLSQFYFFVESLIK